MKDTSIKVLQEWINSLENKANKQHAEIEITSTTLSLKIYKDRYDVEKTITANSIPELKERVAFEKSMVNKYTKK